MSLVARAACVIICASGLAGRSAQAQRVRVLLDTVSLDTVSLDEALQAARSANAHLPLAALNAALVREQLREATGRGRPGVYLDGDVHAGAPTAYTSSDSRLQLIGADTLFDGGRFRAGIRSARYLASAASAGYRMVQKDVDLNVRTQFAEGLHDQRALEIRRASLDELRSYLLYIESQQKGGLGVTADVLRTRTRVATEEANIVDAERSFDVAQVELNDLMGRPPRQPLTLASLPRPAPPIVARGEPWRTVPDILSAEANAAASVARIAATRADRRPSIWVTADAGRLQPIGNSAIGAGLNNGAGTGAEATLWFTWPLWDAGGLFKSRLAQARITAQIAADSAFVVRRQAELEWSRATEQLEDLYRAMELRSRSVPIARDSYLQAQSLYRGGVGTALDVIDAYSAWVDAQIAEADAIRDYRQTEAQLLRWGSP